MNVSSGKVQTTEVNIESDELYSTGIITNVVDNNSTQDTVVPGSKKYFLKFFYTI